MFPYDIYLSNYGRVTRQLCLLLFTFMAQVTLTIFLHAALLHMINATLVLDTYVYVYTPFVC